MDVIERMRTLIDPILVEHEADLYDLEFTGGVLRVTIDQPDGVDMGTIGSVTRAISRMIDEEDPIPGAFTLEVSSPGLERALRTPAHFGAAIGETVNIKTRAGVEGERRFKGTIVSADDDGVTFDTEAGPRTLGYDEIERARTIFEWGPTPKPGSAGASPSTKKNKAAKP